VVSSSKTKQTSQTENKDNRIVASENAIAVNSEGGPVKIQVVADEAFELAEFALSRVSDSFDNTSEIFAQSLRDTQKAARTESAQLSEQIIKIGIPALALVFLVSGMRNK
jgi:hypothetical protein